MSMTYFITAEVIDICFSTQEIDVDVDTYEVEAIDELSAIELLRERLEYRDEHNVRGIHNYSIVPLS